MKKLFSRSNFFALASFCSTVAYASPMDPASQPPPGNFSAEVQSKFVLLGDSNNGSIVYYIPLRGSLAVQSPHTSSPIPMLSAASNYVNDGIFAGEEFTYLGGSFSTVGDLGALNTLLKEANSQGLKAVPAPASEAKTIFMTSAATLSNGRLDIVCKKDPVDIVRNGETKTIYISECRARDDESRIYDKNIDLMYRFNSLPVSSSNIASDVPFQAILFTPGTNILKKLLRVGQSWNNVLTAKVDWKIKSDRPTRKAVVEINWEQAFEQAEAFAAYHNNSCVDIEVKAFFEKLATCDDASKCGVKVMYQKQGEEQLTSVPPNDKEFIDVVNTVKSQLQDELFAQVLSASSSTLGRVDQSKNAQFVLRANFEKKMMSRHESREILWNPGSTIKEASTIMNISCVKGGFEERVSWMMEEEGCKALLGR